jgi:DNA-binding NarL/FixJ family response regulator
VKEGLGDAQAFFGGGKVFNMPSECVISATPSPSKLQLRRVLILKTQLLYAETLATAARVTFPGADIVFSNRVQVAAHELQVGVLDLLITDLEMSDGDMLDFLYQAMRNGRGFRMVLVATARRDVRTMEALGRLPIAGVFDTEGGTLGEFSDALRSMALGRGYWSKSLDSGPRRLSRPRSSTVDDHLTPLEQLVFSVIGDGTDDQEAADQLGIKESSVHTIRRTLHRKLRVQHRGELVRHAVQKGFVRFTGDGVQRPGFAMLLADSPRRMPASE